MRDVRETAVDMLRVGCAIRQLGDALVGRGVDGARIVQSFEAEPVEIEGVELVAPVVVVPAAPNDEAVAFVVCGAATPSGNDRPAATEIVVIARGGTDGLQLRVWRFRPAELSRGQRPAAA